MSSPDSPRPELDATRIASGSTPVAPSAPAGEVQARLGAYRILKRLGSGGMGQIFLGVQETLGRQVAIKVLPQGVLGMPEAIERFRREVQVLGQLSHKNICPVVEAGVEGSTHYYVMEYLRGMDLSRVLRTQRIDPRRAAEIAAQVARALQCAHEHNVIHRDVKPLNVMLQRGDRARSGKTVTGSASMGAEAAADQKMPSPEWTDHAVLIDFGLARDGGNVSDLTVSGAVVGTPSYMAPEQARGDRKAISAATDVYSLGATMYEMLCLRPPFEGETVGEVLDKVRNEEPGAPGKINALVDRDLDTIVLKALEKEPARRYASAGEMADDLDRWLAHEPIRARPVSLAYRVRKLVVRNPLASAAIGMAAVLGLAGLWLLFAPGTLEIPGTLRDAVVTVRGRVVTGTEVLVWPPGSVRVSVKLPNYYEWKEDYDVGPRSRVAMQPALRREMGSLTLTSDPPQVGIELKPLDGGETIVAASPAKRYPLETGKYHVKASARNCFPREFDIEIRVGQEISRNITLSGMVSWTANIDPGVQDWVVGDVNGDRYPDILVSTHQPARIRAISGRDGKLLWVGPLPPEAESGASLGIADLDGDLVSDPEYFLTGQGIVVLDGATGSRRRTILLPGMLSAFVTGDIDGDGLADLLGIGTATISAFRGTDGTLIWTADVETGGRVPVPARLNADEAGDFVIQAPGKSLSAIDGRTGAVLWSAKNGTPYLPLAADLDGNGIDDVVILEDRGYVARSGLDGREIWVTPAPGQEYPAPGIAGDIDGDGAIELIMGRYDALSLYEGATGRFVRSLPISFGTARPGLCDVTGDGVPEIIAGADMAIVALDGRNFGEVWRFATDSAATGLLFADLNCDGKAEALLPTIAGTLTVIETDPTPILWRQGVPHPHTERPELVGSPADRLYLPGKQGHLIGARDGQILKTYSETGLFYSTSAPGPDGTLRVALDGLGPALLDPTANSVTWQLQRPRTFTAPCLADVNGDGVPDVIAGDSQRGEPLEAFDGRDGTELWKAPIARTVGCRLAVTPGRLWVPAAGGLHLLDLKTGGKLALAPLGGLALSAISCGGDVICASSIGRISRMRTRPDGNEIETIWVRETGLSLSHHTLAVSGPSLFAATGSGQVACLDPETGSERWRVSVDAPFNGEPSPCDLDGDGRPEVAVPGFEGSVVVLDGRDGHTLWRRNLTRDLGWASPVWSDLNGDGRPELLVPCRDGWLYAFSIDPPARNGLICWPNNNVFSEAAGLALGREENLRVRLLDLRRSERWSDLLVAARDGSTAFAAWNGAMAASRLGDLRSLAELAAIARRRGCRRLDLDLVQASLLPEVGRAAVLADAMLAAPLSELRHTLPEADLAAAWREASGLALTRAVGWERVVQLSAASGDWDDALREAEAARAGAEPGRVDLALGCAAVQAERWEEARDFLNRAMRFSSTVDEANAERLRINVIGVSSLSDSGAAFRAGQLDRGVFLAERAFRITPPTAASLNALAWTLVIHPGANSEQGRHAAGWARRAVEILKAAPGDPSLLADVLDTLGAAEFLAGDFQAAIRAETEALALPVDQARRTEFGKSLGKYEEAVRKR